MDSKQKLLARTLTITLASASSGAFAAQSYSPFVDRKGLETVYWGDTHLHTAYSTDAGMIGNTMTPDDAYRFARGEEVTSSTGIPARLVRPLDFLVVSDHAENLGLAPMIAESNPRLLSNPWGKDIHDMVKAGKLHEKIYNVALSDGRSELRSGPACGLLRAGT